MHTALVWPLISVAFTPPVMPLMYAVLVAGTTIAYREGCHKLIELLAKTFTKC